MSASMPTRLVALLAVTLTLALAAAALWWATFKQGRPVCVDYQPQTRTSVSRCLQRGAFTRAHGGLMLGAMLTTAAAAGAALAAALTRRTP